MNARERFHATMNFGSPDRVPYWEIIGWWGRTLELWHEQGLPEDVHLGLHFGLDRREGAPVSHGLVPAYKYEILEEDEHQRVERRQDGSVCRQIKTDEQNTIPQYLSFPVSDRASWNEYKKRLDPKSPVRRHPYWEDYVRCVKGRDYPLGIHGGSLFGWIRNWMGFEAASMAIYDQPDLVEEMMDHIADFVIELIEPALRDIGDLDYAFFWEDMCYKAGCIISPRHFKQFMVPRYQRITSVMRKYGVKVLMVDCDGNHDEITPLWLEGGLTGVYPLEVAAGEDPVALRKQYGKDLHLCGGIDKRALAKDRKAIEEEVHAKVPFLCEAGGWIPSIDHAVPSDVPFENYLYYWELVRRIAERG